MHDTTERLVKTAITVTRDQFDRLRRRGKREQRSFSYYVRVALDRAYPPTEDDDERDRESAA